MWNDSLAQELSRLLPYLKEELQSTRPDITGEDFQAVALSAKHVAGYEKCMNDLHNLATFQHQPDVSTPNFISNLED